MVLGKPIILRISGKDLIVPQDLWNILEGPRPKPVEYLVSDGCSFAPDVLRVIIRLFKREAQVILFPACWIHDAQYARVAGADLGGDWIARRKADWILAKNLFRLCRAQDVSRTGAIIVATTYWTAVRMHGAAKFPFDLGKEPLSRLERWREVALLFWKGADFE